MKKFFLLLKNATLALILLSPAAYGTEHALLYVNSGSTIIDQNSFTSLTGLVSTLNNYGRATNDHYSLIVCNYFSSAINYAKTKPGNEQTVFGIYHGVFSVPDGIYTGNVQDKTVDSHGNPVSTPDAEVDPNFNQSFHCNADGKISTDEIGRQISQRTGQYYPPASGVSGGTSGGTTFGSSSSADGYWTMVSYDAQYSYFDSSGTMHVVAYIETVWVWTSSPSGQVYLALHQRYREIRGYGCTKLSISCFEIPKTTQPPREKRLTFSGT